MKTMTNAALSRRSLLAGSALATAGTPTLDAFGATVRLFEAEGRAALDPHPDAELLRLALDWLDTWALGDRLSDEADDLHNAVCPDLGRADLADHPEVRAAWDRWERVDQRHRDLSRTIGAKEPRTLDGALGMMAVAIVSEWEGEVDLDTKLSAAVLHSLARLARVGGNELAARIIAHPLVAEIFGDGAPAAVAA